MAKNTKIQKPVDDDFEVELLRRRYGQLRGYRDTAEREMDEIKAKLEAKADELGAEQLTVGGASVVSISHFPRLSIDCAKILRDYPTVWMVCEGKSTPVTRVDVR